MLDHEQIKASDLIHELYQPGMGRIRQARPAAKFDATPVHLPRSAAQLGEHTAEVLTELGFNSEEIVRFRDARIIG